MTFQNPNEPTKNNGSQREDGMQRMMGAVMNAIYSRSRFMLSRGGRYDGEADPRRNIGAECGWPAAEDVTPEAMGDMYDRFAVAARVNDLFPEECWQVTPKIYEDEDPQALTPFEEALDDLAKQLRGESFYEGEEGNPLFEHLLRMDRLCGVGSYGVMLLGLDDGKDLNEPAEGIDETGKMSGSGGGDRKLLFLREFDERLAPVSTWETERENPRYGQPTSYSLTFDDPKLTGAKGSGRATETVHWSRVVHVADNLTTSDVFGVPRMRPVYNDLLDLRKLYGGSAEMYWQGAFPGVGFKTDPQLGADVAFPTDFADTMEKYMNGLQRWLAVGGVEPRMLSPTVVSPEVQIKVHLEAICVRLGVPLRIFLGSERGELASSQDARAWNGRLRLRQTRFLTPRLLVPVVDRLIAVGVLPKPKSYAVEWPDIAQKSEQEQLDAALKKTQALAAYVQGQLESVVTPIAYFTTFLGFTEEEAASILEEAETNVAEKLALDLPPIGQEFAKPEPAMPFGGAPGQGQPMVDEQGQPLPPDEQIDAEAELKKQDLAEPKGDVPPQLKPFVPAQNALPAFLQKDDAEKDVEEQDALLEPEVDPVTGEPVEPEIDPLTGEPVDVDPLTGEPIDGAGDPYQALLDEVAPTLEVRGGLLPSDHKPSLRDRLTRAGGEEGAGTATFDDDEDAALEEEPLEGEEPEEDEGEITDYENDEEEFVEEEEEVENVFCPTGEGGGVDPGCGDEGVAGVASAKAVGKAQAKATIMKNPWSEQIASENDRFYNAKRAADWTNEHFAEAAGEMTADDLKGVDVYVGGRFSNINDGLRGTEKLDDVDKAAIKGLDSAIAKSESPEDVVVFRGATGVGFLGDPAKLVGKTIKEKGYTSTTLMEDVANGFAYSKVDQDDARFEIKVPKGSKMLSVDSLLGEDSLNQHEMVLPRGSKFKVTGATPKSIKVGGREVKRFWVIEMELQT